LYYFKLNWVASGSESPGIKIKFEELWKSRTRRSL